MKIPKYKNCYLLVYYYIYIYSISINTVILFSHLYKCIRENTQMASTISVYVYV